MLNTELVILNNERDRRSWQWLIDHIEEPILKETISHLTGKRKPYVSSVCNALKVELPEEVILGMSKHEYALMHLEKAKARLKKA